MLVKRDMLTCALPYRDFGCVCSFMLILVEYWSVYRYGGVIGEKLTESKLLEFTGQLYLIRACEV